MVTHPSLRPVAQKGLSANTSGQQQPGIISKLRHSGAYLG